MKKPRILVSGGGTGGHIFPAISIAKALKERLGAEILFVGADNRMEMEKVPAAGFEIIGLPVAGFNRKNLLSNIGVLLKLRKSLGMARRIVKDFRPDIAVGVGGYCSGPTLKAAQRLGVPTVIQEQNSYAGVTNKLLAKKARKICVAYPGMERFFPADRIVMTGNPVRRELVENVMDRRQARRSFGLDPDRDTLLVIGGSLGARTVNEGMEAGLRQLTDAGCQVIWQTGKFFGNRGTKAAKGLKGVVVTEFLNNMAAAYSAATLVVSRAGASSISELELLGKPSILVPSPNVAEDHQTKNAMALKKAGAAEVIADAEVPEKLVPAVISLMGDPEKREKMSAAALSLALPDSDQRIADEIEKILETEK